MRARVTGALTLVVAMTVAGCTGDGSPAASDAPTTTIVVTPPAGSATSTAATSTATSTAAPTVTDGTADGQAPAPAAPARGGGSGQGDPQVRALQKALSDHGYEVPVTGVFGPLTRSAVERVQRDHGLEVDGVAGPRFWQALTGGSAPTDASPVRTDPPEPSGGGSSSSAPATTAAPAPVSCDALHDEWAAAVRAGSRSRSVSAHERAQAAGCRPNTWLAPGTTPRQAGGSHARGDSCTMREVGSYDDAGLVCTQDVEGSPHWN